MNVYCTDYDVVKKVDKAMRRQASKMPDFIFKANDIRAQSLHEIMKLWRPAVLLRPAWVMRVVGDEQLRMFAKVGTTERMWKLLSEDRPKYVQKVLENALVKTGAVTIKGGKVHLFLDLIEDYSSIRGSKYSGPSDVRLDRDYLHQIKHGLRGKTEQNIYASWILVNRLLKGTNYAGL